MEEGAHDCGTSAAHMDLVPGFQLDECVCE
jgi:hypothetical protein